MISSSISPDFTNLPRMKKAYAGANGSKLSVLYRNELYLLKFQAPAKRKTNSSYANSCITEYIGCKIFESTGIPTQEVLLGTYTTNTGKVEIVVACKDFTTPELVFQDFASFKNQNLTSEWNGYGTELSDILETFEQQTMFDHRELTKRFWDIFIVDALIGNWDRHNGNWGFLYDRKTDSLSFAPVFDCGSSLFPKADEAIMQMVLSDEVELNTRIFTIPLSAIKQDGKKINYFDFISSLENEDCNAALARSMERIDMAKIKAIVDETPFITELHKTFLNTMLTERYEKILESSFRRLQSEAYPPNAR